MLQDNKRENTIKSNSKRHLKAIEDSHKMGLSQELPKIVQTLFKNVKKARDTQCKIDNNTYAKATGYPVPYPDI